MTTCTPASTCVVSVNYNNAEVTLQCIESLMQLDDAPGAIVIVDNGSSPQILERLFEGWQHLAEQYQRIVPHYCTEQEHFPNTGDVLLSLKCNCGFSGGNNAALKRLVATRLECTAFWLLNNDAFPQNGALHELCSRATNGAIVGSTLVYADNPTVVQCAAGGKISKYTGATQFICGKKSLHTVVSLDNSAIENKLDYINAASLLVYSDTFSKLGFLPEEYFLYYEDADFCTLAKRVGYKLRWAKKSIVQHREGASSAPIAGKTTQQAPKNVRVDYYSIRNRIYFIKKFFNKYIFLAFAGACYSLFLRIGRGHWKNVKVVSLAINHAICGRMCHFDAQ